MQYIELIYNLFIFLLGLCIGSFLNVVIYRIEEDKSFLKGRSFCPNCKHNLNWKDLFPVFSFLYLQGKCRYCKAKISWQYPAVELATALIFLLIFNFQFSIFNEFSITQLFNLFFWFYIVSILIIIFIYDLKHYLIPDNVLFPAIVISFLYRLAEYLNLYNFNILELISNFKFQISNLVINQLLAVIIASGFFFTLWFLSSGRWMGFGDVKLAILLGLILGWPNILVGLFLAFFIGSIVSLFLLGLRSKKLKSQVPFGPFLITGTFIAMFWGNQIINWYLNLAL